MKRFLAAICTCSLVLLAASSAQAGSPPANCFSVPGSSCFKLGPHKLPKTVKEFKALRSKLMSANTEVKKAYGGAALFLYALMVRTYDKSLGNKFLVMSLTKDGLTKGNHYKGYTWSRSLDYHVKRITSRSQIPRSHVVGSSPKNNYKVNFKKALKLVFRKQTAAKGSDGSKYVPDPATGKYKIFSCSSGAATCRPMALRRNKKGIWKVKSFSSISVGIMAGGPTTGAEEPDVVEEWRTNR